MTKVLDGRIALVTGASRGIGYHAALAYATAGAHVIALARTVGGLEELDDEIKAEGGLATLVPLDLKDFDGLDRLGDTVLERWGRLDVLLANAAILGTVTPLHQMKPAVFDDIFTINVTANFRLIRALEPALQKSKAGRAIFVTSGAVRSNPAFMGPYSASKAALEAMVKSWANENQKTALCANLFDPATARTKMRAQYAPGEDPETVTPPEDLAPALVELARAGTVENGGIYSFADKGWFAR